MSKECKLSNDAYSQTVFQLSATCICTKIFNLKNILFNKWIALDSRTCLYISSPKNIKQIIYNMWPLQKTIWNIDIHICLLTAHFCVHTCLQATLVWIKKKFNTSSLESGIGHLSENIFFSGGHLSENYFSFTWDFSRTLSEFHFIICYDIFWYEIKINHIKI
jgi:hypothetical protein